MPSVFEQLLTQQLPQMRDAFGVPGCVYTAPDGVTVFSGLTIQLQRDDPMQIDRPTRADGEMQTAEIKVLLADLANCVKGGRFTVAGQTGPEVWTIAATPLIESGRFVCKATRSSTDRLMPRRQKE